MENGKKRLKISFNSPVVLSFALICLIAFVLGKLTNDASTRLLFSVYRAPLSSPSTWLRFIGHVFGHASWEHFFGNITLLLVVGPVLEEKYGSFNLLIVILATALATGLVHFLLFPHVQLLGASGVVFAFILLASFSGYQDGAVPFTFLLVAVIYIGGQIYNALFVSDNVANLTHILGGAVGSGLGYVMEKHKMGRYH